MLYPRDETSELPDGVYPSRMIHSASRPEVVELRKFISKWDARMHAVHIINGRIYVEAERGVWEDPEPEALPAAAPLDTASAPSQTSDNKKALASINKRVDALEDIVAQLLHPALKTPEPATPSKPSLNAADIDGMTHQELRAAAKKLGISSTGGVRALRTRLRRHVAAGSGK